VEDPGTLIRTGSTLVNLPSRGGQKHNLFRLGSGSWAIAKQQRRTLEGGKKGLIEAAESTRSARTVKGPTRGPVPLSRTSRPTHETQKKEKKPNVVDPGEFVHDHKGGRKTNLLSETRAVSVGEKGVMGRERRRQGEEKGDNLGRKHLSPNGTLEGKRTGGRQPTKTVTKKTAIQHWGRGKKGKGTRQGTGLGGKTSKKNLKTSSEATEAHNVRASDEKKVDREGTREERDFV